MRYVTLNLTKIVNKALIEIRFEFVYALLDIKTFVERANHIRLVGICLKVYNIWKLVPLFRQDTIRDRRFRSAWYILKVLK